MVNVLISGGIGGDGEETPATDKPVLGGCKRTCQNAQEMMEVRKLSQVLRKRHGSWFISEM